MIGILKERTLLERKIERLEDRLDFLKTEYYENKNMSVNVETMRTLEQVIYFLKSDICVNEIK
jgi:hypothetical protein